MGKVPELRRNPQIKDVDVGVKLLRKIEIYPLSMAQQLELTEGISDMLKIVLSEEGVSNAGVAELGMTFILKNLPTILSYVVDPEAFEGLIEDMTMDQSITIGRIVYDMNYANLEKNVVRPLVKKALTLLKEKTPSGGPLQQFASNMDIGSTISTEKPGEKAA